MGSWWLWRKFTLQISTSLASKFEAETDFFSIWQKHNNCIIFLFHLKNCFRKLLRQLRLIERNTCTPFVKAPSRKAWLDCLSHQIFVPIEMNARLKWNRRKKQFRKWTSKRISKKQNFKINAMKLTLALTLLLSSPYCHQLKLVKRSLFAFSL